MPEISSQIRWFFNHFYPFLHLLRSAFIAPGAARKFQIPKDKLQKSSKIQLPNLNPRLELGRLRIGTFWELVFCHLDLPEISSLARTLTSHQYWGDCAKYDKPRN